MQFSKFLPNRSRKFRFPFWISVCFAVFSFWTITSSEANPESSRTFFSSGKTQLRNQSPNPVESEGDADQNQRSTKFPGTKNRSKILSIADRAALTFRSMIKQILWVAAPIAAFALVFHFLETFVLQRLVERFGWNAALWTGWIGTPIHESSHALLCIVFQHKIEKMALFQPDLQERRLGFVRHTYTKGKLWQEIGNFFIGLAPLAGGTLTLLLFSWMLYPQLVQPFLTVPSSPAATAQVPETNQTTPERKDGKLDSIDKSNADDSTDSKIGFTDLSLTVAGQFGELFTVSNLVSWRFWLFLYLVTCVTVHMAPSSSDYQGAKQGGLILFGFWLAAHLVHGLLGLSMESWGGFFWPLWFHSLGVLVLATGLGLLVMGMVFLVTEAWDIAFRRNPS